MFILVFLKVNRLVSGLFNNNLKFEPRKNPFRQTDQHLLPVVKIMDTSKYDIYPTHEIPIGSHRYWISNIE